MKWNKSAMNRVQPQVQVGHGRQVRLLVRKPLAGRGHDVPSLITLQQTKPHPLFQREGAAAGAAAPSLFTCFQRLP